MWEIGNNVVKSFSGIRWDLVFEGSDYSRFYPDTNAKNHPNSTYNTAVTNSLCGNSFAHVHDFALTYIEQILVNLRQASKNSAPIFNVVSGDYKLFKQSRNVHMSKKMKALKWFENLSKFDYVQRLAGNQRFENEFLHSRLRCLTSKIFK